jgi:hypothetical protein
MNTDIPFLWFASKYYENNNIQLCDIECRIDTKLSNSNNDAYITSAMFPINCLIASRQKYFLIIQQYNISH